MRRRIPLVVAAVLLLAAVLSACGSKNADSIVKDLDKVKSKMESYEGSGTMTLHTGQQPLTYKVEVRYQKPNFYRIALTNEKRDITQIVLRNGDGVFVLTPSLNKSYRFQSDWPENQGQVYLYQTLLQSILVDNSRQFTTDKDAYIFDVMAGNYQNGSFARQKIWLDKENYAPKQVQVTDTNANVMVDVKFDSFAFDKKFDSLVFDMNENMKQPNSQSSSSGPDASNSPDASQSPSASGKPTDGESSPDPEATAGTNEEPTSGSIDKQPDTVTVSEPDPDALPVGVKQIDGAIDVQLGDSMGVMLRYTGTYDFTILEMASKDRAASLSEGIVLDLGFTYGLLTGTDTKTLTWSYAGVEYRLTTNDLPEEDMVAIAQSMEESSGK
ncbi:outer membrane lipoprotein carrier protein LolA [Cohnella faecalis]|uniref:Outer membrane lipoprotein carrier protein LolA n=1 Tax=Cohnella faecalis TaxID=2315694 RepID=A0A398CER7_9BACL|nr:outer membrane lipoprotein carrier protein LolA [Cohnella faecalis]RIE00945.1 outer membrane lipoprotein carrier protein LolA [Cohnella faecalis]